MDNDFSLSLYRIFNAVAESGNISKAASAMFISQPAVSKSILKLEEELGTALFIRNSRGVKLTEEGRILYNYTKSAFDALAEAENTLKNITSLGIAQLNLGASTTLCKYIMLPHIKEFIKANPHINFNIECQSTFDTLALLKDKKIDIGLIGKPKNEAGIEFLCVGTIKDIFVTTPSYMKNLCLRTGRNLSSTELFSEANLMLLDEQNITRQYIDEYFIKYNIKSSHILQLSNMDLLIEFAKTGIGIACVIKEFVKNELNDGTLIEVPFLHSIKPRQIGYAFPKKAVLSKSAQLFSAYIKENHKCE